MPAFARKINEDLTLEGPKNGSQEHDVCYWKLNLKDPFDEKRKTSCEKKLRHPLSSPLASFSCFENFKLIYVTSK